MITKKIRKKFRDLKIKYKLFFLSIVTNIIGIFIFSILLIFFNVKHIRQKEYNNALVHSKIISKNIAFNLDIALFDKTAPEKTKLQLKHFSSIRNLDLIVVYKADSSIFTYLENKGYKGNIPSIKNITSGFNMGRLIIFNSIEGKNKILGYLLLVYNNKDIYNQIIIYIRYIITISILSLFIVFFLSTFLQKFISKPIITLTKLTKELTEKEDFSVNLETDRNDEIGVLYNVFSEMLKKIYFRDLQMKQTNENLMNAKIFLRNVIDAMPSVLVSIDSSGRINQWNLAASTFFNKEEKDVLGKYFEQVDPLFRKYKEGIKYAIKYKETIRYFREVLIEEDGNKKYINIVIFPMSLKHDIGVVLRIDDITELEKKELQLQQAQKMESIGLLAGGIAHDFNNLLTGIIGVVTILDYKLKNNIPLGRDELDKSLKHILDTTNKASDVVRHLLVLSRKQDMSFKKIDIDIALNNIIKICENTFDRSIEIRYDKKVDSPALVLADQSQIEQAFLNIAINAYHAMTVMRKKDEHKGGKLIFSLDRVIADEFFLKSHPKAVLNIVYFVVRISDTGVGIPKEIIDKIFDPFFSTKEKNKGTGLGLSIVYNIIQQHNGFITVYSELNKGTTFNIYLPRLTSDIFNDSHDSSTGEDKITLKKGSGTILVIDDERLILDIEKDILTECGYKVITASNGKEALEIFKQEKDKISLIILDLNMPIMDGNETYFKLKEIKNDIKIIICSGFIHDEKLEVLVNNKDITFIQKPFNIKQLSDIVYEVLYEKN